MNDAPDRRFSPETRELLRAAGWHEGRDVSRELRLPRGFTPFAAAERVLSEFGNLRVGTPGPGIASARAPLVIDPMLALGEDDRFGELERELGARLYPLGETADGHQFVAIDEHGRVFLIFGVMSFAGDTFDAALDTLLRGAKQLPVVDESGHW